jgi:hypothetical protein
MSFATLQQQHEALMARQDALAAEDTRQRTPAAEQIFRDAQQLVSDVVAQSHQVADPRERDLLRAYMRYWATFIYEWSGVFPKTDLRPAEIAAPPPSVVGVGTAPPSPPPSRRLPAWVWPTWVWGVLGLLGVLLLVFLFTQAFSDSDDPGLPPPATELPPPAATATATTIPDVAEPSDLATPLPLVTRTAVPDTSEPPPPIDERNAARLQPLQETQAHTGAALAVDFDPQKPEVATAGVDGQTRFWALPGLALSRQVAAPDSSWVRTVAYSPNTGQPGVTPLVLAGGNDRVLRIYDVESLQLFAQFRPAALESGFVFAAEFSPDGTLVASGHGDGIARVWNVATGTESGSVGTDFISDRLAVIQSAAPVVNDVAYGDEDGLLALALGDTRWGVQVVESPSGRPLCTFETGSVLAVDFAPGGDRLAAGTEDGRLVLFWVDDDDCEEVTTDYPAHEGGVTGVAFSPGGEWLVTGGRDGTIKIWAADGTLAATHEVGATVNAVAVSPDARYIATVDSEGRLILWEIS